MANASILAAFERMWQHVVAVVSNKSDIDHAHDDATQEASGFLSAEDKTQLDNGGIPIVDAASSDGVAYTATVDGITALTVGAKITIIPAVVSTALNITLNVNGLGAKNIRMPVTYNTSATSNGPIVSWLVKGKPVTLEYDGSYWKTISLPRPSAQYLYGSVPVANGGTGATTAADARTNLGLNSKYEGQSIISVTQQDGGGEVYYGTQADLPAPYNGMTIVIMPTATNPSTEPKLNLNAGTTYQIYRQKLGGTYNGDWDGIPVGYITPGFPMKLTFYSSRNSWLWDDYPAINLYEGSKPIIGTLSDTGGYYSCTCEGLSEYNGLTITVVPQSTNTSNAGCGICLNSGTTRAIWRRKAGSTYDGDWESIPANFFTAGFPFRVTFNSTRTVWVYDEQPALVASYVGTAPVTTSGTGAAYTASVPGVTSLTNGLSIVVIPHTVSTSRAPTLNINGLGAKSIARRVSTETGALRFGASESWLTADIPIRLMYDNGYWVVEGCTLASGDDMNSRVPIENGGTGGSTLDEARANLGLKHVSNSGDILTTALSLTPGVYTLQNLGASTPSKFRYTMSLVMKNTSDRCTVMCITSDGIYTNIYTDGTWGGWHKSTTSAVTVS